MYNYLLDIRIFFYKTLHKNIGISASIFNGIITILILISASITPLLFIEYFQEIYSSIYTIEECIVIVFIVEYILRIWSAKNPLIYLFSRTSIINSLSVFPLSLYLSLDLNTNQSEYFFILLLLQYIRVLKFFYLYKDERDAMCENIQKNNINGEFTLQNNEQIFTIIKKHSLFFFLSLFPVLFLTFASITVPLIFNEYIITIPITLFALSITIFIFIKNWIDFNYDAIYVTNKRLVIQNKHIFGVTLNSIRYDSITNINPDSSGIQNSILNSGHITIDTGSTSQEKIVFRHVEHMSEAMNAILSAENKAQEEKTQEVEEKQDRAKKTKEHDKNKKHVHTLDFKLSSQDIQNHVLKKIVNILLNK